MTTPPNMFPRGSGFGLWFFWLAVFLVAVTWLTIAIREGLQ